jgi:hypothetical protein
MNRTLPQIALPLDPDMDRYNHVLTFRHYRDEARDEGFRGDFTAACREILTDDSPKAWALAAREVHQKWVAGVEEFLATFEVS